MGIGKAKCHNTWDEFMKLAWTRVESHPIMHGTVLPNRMGTDKITYHIAWYGLVNLAWE